MPDLPQRRNPRRFVGESYRDCVDRLAGQLSATEKDRDALQARVEVLIAALTEILELHRPCIDSAWPAPGHCAECERTDEDGDMDYVPYPCPTALAALAAGETEARRG